MPPDFDSELMKLDVDEEEFRKFAVGKQLEDAALGRVCSDLQEDFEFDLLISLLESSFLSFLFTFFSCFFLCGSMNALY